MYNEIPTILFPKELLDKAFARAAKITKEDKESTYRVLKTTLAQLESIRDTLVETLERTTKRFPNLDKIDTYERELIDIVIGVEPLRRALGRVQGATAIVTRVLNEQIRNTKDTRDIQVMKKAKSAAIGRASSIVEDLEEPLAFLARAREILRYIPEVTPGDLTVVVAGYPNVGKSSLLAKLSRARPEIAPYAYTTKQVNVGHFYWPESAPEHRRRRYQVVDTPGLLEKPPEDRNAIERQAAIAIRYLADLILFVLDPTETCGFPLPKQLALLEQVRAEFPGAPLLVVENKADLQARRGKNLRISCTTGEGLPELKQRIVEAAPPDKYQDVFSEDPERS